MQIENGLYRIRIINGCGSRYLNITFNFLNDSIIPFTVVKADGNYLNSSY
jgi:FtsP/CotA-like multicopper oxidase with cupredoxin domain